MHGKEIDAIEHRRGQNRAPAGARFRTRPAAAYIWSSKRLGCATASGKPKKLTWPTTPSSSLPARLRSMVRETFFDHCTTLVSASTVNGFVTHLGHSPHHVPDLIDLPHARHMNDIALVSNDKQAWMVDTGDGRIPRTTPERAAFGAAGLSGFWRQRI